MDRGCRRMDAGWPTFRRSRARRKSTCAIGRSCRAAGRFRSREASGPHGNATGGELVFGDLTLEHIKAVEFDVVNGDPRLALPRTICDLERNVAFVAPTDDHRRYLAGLRNMKLGLPPVTVLQGWRASGL